MSFLARAAVVVAMAGLIGCGGNVVVDGNSKGTGGAGATGAGGVGDGGNGGGGGDDPVDPPPLGNALVVQDGSVLITFSSQNTLTCQSPDPDTSGCGWWTLDIRIPDFLFQVGTLDLETSGADVFAQEASEVGPGGECGGSAGGGGDLPGTLVISSIGDTKAEVSLMGLNYLFIDGQPDGSYVAAICK